jgi:hypothetical protein
LFVLTRFFREPGSADGSSPKARFARRRFNRADARYRA